MIFDSFRFERVLLAAGAMAALAACSDRTVTNTVSAPATQTVQTNLVSDVSGFGAAMVDPNLVNPWGLAFGGTGILWVANNGTGTSTLYDVSGTSHPPIVTIPAAAGGTTGTPTGTVFNGTTDFTIPGFGSALFIFATEDGTLSAWNATTGNAVLVSDQSASNAVFKGLALASDGGVNFVYATDFRNDAVDMFNGSFQLTKSFTDKDIPQGYGPFGIQNIGGMLYVTYAKQTTPDAHDDDPGVGHGFVDIFNPDGTLSRRFASSGRLNSPWGIAQAPAEFGTVGGDILIGNFGDGLIGAYDPTTGALLSFLEDTNGAAVSIDGLWALTFGPGSSSNTLFFSSGPSSEGHGLLGTLTPR